MAWKSAAWKISRIAITFGWGNGRSFEAMEISASENEPRRTLTATRSFVRVSWAWKLTELGVSARTEPMRY